MICTFFCLESFFVIVLYSCCRCLLFFRKSCRTFPLKQKRPLHIHAKCESPRYHLYSPSPGPSDPSDSISFVLNEVSPREQLLSVHCSGSEATFHFRIPKPSSSQWTVLSGGAKNVLLFFPAFHLLPRPALSFIRFASQPQIFSDCSFLI